MGTESIPSRVDSTTINATWFNILKSVLALDLVPRNGSGDATTRAGSLGSTTYKWLKAHIESGYWTVGDIKTHHTYNGTAPISQGWMLCDGRIINQANYDTEHGAGSWATYVGSSSLDGKYLPNFVGKYEVGAASTTATGAGAISSVGNTSHQINLEHNHQWYNSISADGSDQTWDSNGNALGLTSGSKTDDGVGGNHYAIVRTLNADTATIDTPPDSYTDNQLSTAQSIQPESIQVVKYMRII